MERLRAVAFLAVPSETAAASAAGYVSWDEVFVSSDKGRREVHYYLRRGDGSSDLAVIGKERSLRHMSYHFAASNQAVNSLASVSSLARPKSRREVLDWLNSIVAEVPLDETMYSSGDSLDCADASPLDFGTAKGDQAAEFSWAGPPSTCRKKRRHYQSFCRNGIKISVHSFVYVLAEEDKRLVAYLEDMYEDSRGNKMVVVRWFHRIDEHFEKFRNEVKHSQWEPYVCRKQFEVDDVRPFDITQLKGYWRQEILRYMYNSSPSKTNVYNRQSYVEEDVCAHDMRPKKRHRISKDDDLQFTRGRESLDACDADTRGLTNCLVSAKSGTEFSGLKGGISDSSLARKDVKQNPFSYLTVGSQVEVLSQDSGIRGCWFRAFIVKSHKDKVKVRYEDLHDAEDESSKLEEWISASRVAAPDQLGLRASGRTTIRPHPQVNGRRALSIEVGTVVDVWWHDGWWEGIIIQKEPDGKVLVSFPGEKRESFFMPSDLRCSLEWLGNRWMHLKDRPDIATSILSSFKNQEAAARTTAGNPSEAVVGNGSPSRKEDSTFRDLSKDALLSGLKWKSSRKRTHVTASSHPKSQVSDGQSKKSSPGRRLNSATCEKFIFPSSLKVDHDNCKYIGDSPFGSSVVPPVTSLVMSR